MADFKIYIKQERGTSEWGNTFNITAADEAEAATRGASIAALLAVSVWSGVNFVGVRVSSAAEDGRTGRTFPLSLTGSVSMANPLPIFCVGRLLFYPGVKQNGKCDVRFIGNATSQVAGDWTSGFYASLVNLADAIIDLGYVCDKSFTPYTGSGAEPRVGMRQTYRKGGDRLGLDPGDV